MNFPIFSGHIEIRGLRVMIESYTQNPSFGNPRMFDEELESSILRVQKMESELHSQNMLLQDINRNLELKQSLSQRNLPLLSHPTGLYNQEGSTTSSSTGYGTISNYSSSEVGSERGEDVENVNSVLVIALYPYNGECGESSIAMEAGEQFVMTEGDEGGWSRVRRLSQGEEGFVPTAFLQWV